MFSEVESIGTPTINPLNGDITVDCRVTENTEGYIKPQYGLIVTKLESLAGCWWCPFNGSLKVDRIGAPVTRDDGQGVTIYEVTARCDSNRRHLQEMVSRRPADRKYKSWCLGRLGVLDQLMSEE